MAFSFKNLARFTRCALLESRGSDYRLTPKRILLLAAFYPLFALLELWTWLGLGLDEILVPEYPVEVREPIFIIGNPRSGTTFLQRLLAQDRKNMTCMQTWEILFAPSVTQRRIVQALARLDDRLGRPLQRALAAWEARWQHEIVAHEIALRAPEEDQYLLIHIWSTLAIWTFSAMVKEADAYTHFDRAVPQAEKRRIMGFYRRCIQRHLYAHRHKDAPGAHYLSKNPWASAQVDTLYAEFPDARFIYVVRSPFDMIPSYISLLDQTWRILADPLEPYSCRRYVLDMARHWYSHPMERLERAPQDSYVIVNFDDLVNDAERTVAAIYQRFNLEISPAFARVLRAEAQQARDHNSRHEYSRQDMGLTREQIAAAYGDILQRFGTSGDQGEELGS
jgi:hypothetical protein